MTDLDTALRDMLRERADDITTVPAAITDLALAPARRHPVRRHPAWLIAAAVAAVLAVVGAAVALRGAAGQPQKVAPATHSPRPTPAPTVHITHRRSCAVPLPAAWTHAVAAGTHRYGALSAMPLAVSPDGTHLLVARDFGQARDVVDVDRAGHVRPIYTVPQPDQYQVQHATVDNSFAAIDLQYFPRSAQNIDGTVRAVVLVDLRTGRAKELDQVSLADMLPKNGVEKRTIDASMLLDGQVYWDVRPVYGNNRGTIRDYDTATGRTRTIFTGRVGWPQLTGAGVSWGGSQVRVRRSLPATVSAALTTSAMRNSLVTDGSAYAWVAGRGVIGWWGPGASITTVRVNGFTGQTLDGVAGPYVAFGGKLMDTRTGALTRLPGLQPLIYGGHGVLASYGFTGQFKESATDVIRIDTTGLPELTC